MTFRDKVFFGFLLDLICRLCNDLWGQSLFCFFCLFFLMLFSKHGGQLYSIYVMCVDLYECLMIDIQILWSIIFYLCMEEYIRKVVVFYMR